MPGIVGIISLVPAADCERLVHSMLTSLMHEPSYLSDVLSVPELGIYAGWVAHPGSFAAAQNSADENHGIALTFSGECLGAEPQLSRGADDNQPSSWVARRYEEQGPNFVASLNGLFSGLLTDRRQKRAVLFNDRYGLERIYIHEHQGTTYFASEVKALLRVLPDLRTFDEAGVAQYLAYGCTLKTRTLFRGVSLLPPASAWVFAPRTPVRRTTYFSPTAWETQEAMSQPQFEAAFAETFSRVLPRYLNEPERLGIALTGGLDTRMIMACLPELPVKPTSYTFSGRTENLLDARIAARIARTCGMEHHLLRIGDDFLKNFRQMVDRSVHISDGCCGATGAHEIYFNRAAAELAPIRLTGNFGSEVFRSVSTFKPLHLDPSLLSPAMKAAVASALATEPAASTHPITFAAFREIPWNLMGTLLTGRSQVVFRTPYLDNELVALAYRAPMSGRMSSFPALRLIESANPELSRIPTDRGQIGSARGAAWLVRRLVAEVTFKLDYYHTEGLPGALAPLTPLINLLAPTGLLGLHKFLPYSRWFRTDLRPFLEEVITDRCTRDLPFFTSPFLASMVEAHACGGKNYSREINAALTLESVDRLILKNPKSQLPSNSSLLRA